MNSTNKLIVQNSIYLFIRTVFLIIINLFTVREVLHILGAEGYGLFNLIFGLVALFIFINGAMTSATQRFISFEISKSNSQGVIGSLFASLIIHGVIGIILVFSLIMSKDYILVNFLNIKVYQFEANWIYNFACFNIIFSFIQSVFVALITSYERMKLFSYISILEGILKLLIVYVLYLNIFNNIIMYSFMLMIVALLILMAYVFFSYRIIIKNISSINFERKKIFHLISDMKNFMGWSLIGNLAWVCKNQGSNILLNIYFGVLLNAAYAISIALTSLINGLLSSVSNAIKPQIFKSYSNGDNVKFYNLIINGTKYYIYFLTLTVMPLIFFMERILSLWLKDVPDYAVNFSILAIILVLIESYSVLLITAVQATGKIVMNQLAVGGILLMNIPISYILLESGYQPNIIFYVSISLSLLALLVKILITNLVSGLDISRFIRSVLLPCSFFSILSAIVFYFIYSISQGYNILILFFAILFAYIVCVFIIYFLFLGDIERDILKSGLNNRIKGI